MRKEFENDARRISIAYDGNIYRVDEGAVDIFDARAVYELYSGMRADEYGLFGIGQRLGADMNGNGVVDMLLAPNESIDDATYLYDGVAMFWSDKYEAFVTMVTNEFEAYNAAVTGHKVMRFRV